ncbi:MAG: hypothetical protein SGI83_06820 [Bacteroidota bacterium]|nr:hypothetical protein [Bacteroidota bacterium]
MRKLSIIGCILLSTVFAGAQQFGGNPPSHQWKQINTDSVRIIFPVGLDSQANRTASIIHYLAGQQPMSLGSQLKKINIVLQNQTTIPNGYVQLGPYRSEFFLTPDPNNFAQGSIPWGDQLALHEYRHVQQFNNFNNGLSKLMKTLFGEEGYALAINASIPDWFYEGDAVYNETVLTKQGRGRLPLFLNAYPSLWQSGKKYSWMKLRNGSFKDYVPNHYNLGYLLVNYGREKYGTDFWARVTKDASAYKGLFYPFQKAIQQHAGVDYKTFREQAFTSYKKNAERVAVNRDEFLLPLKKSYVSNYYFPYAAGAESLVYLKSTYRQRPTFYRKDASGEHKVKIKDIAIDEQFSYRNGKIVYAAYQTDARWGWKDYSVIKVIDVQTGQQKKITSKSKYFTPDISADGSKVAAVQVATNGRSELHIIDADNGQVIKAIHSSEISLFTDPKFIDETLLVTAVRLGDGKMALATAEIATGNTIRLTPPSFNVVGYPCVYNGLIYFTASYEGNDDVFALRMNDKKIFKISDGPLGNYYPNAGNGKVTWSVFTAEGYQLKQMDEKDIKWNEVSTAVAEKLTDKFTVSHGNEYGDVLLNKIPQRNFPVTKYKKGTKLLNFHSWRPYYEDPIFTFSLYGENVLNTLQTELYYLYNQNEQTSAVGFSTVYGALFPFLSLGTELTFNREGFTGNKLRQWNQLDSRVGLNIPLRITSGQTFKNFNIGSNYVLRNEFNRGFFKDSLGNTSYSYLQHFISWSEQVQTAVQHIYPRFAYAVSATYRHAITQYEGNQVNASGSLYLPGFLSTHNLLLTGSFQERDTLRQILLGNRFAYSRGYTGRYFPRMWRVSANYHLPLLYPDWGFGNILYLQRLRANVFYDFTKVSDKKATRDQRSAGAEFFIDTKWWNQYPLTFGFRVSRLLDRDQFDGFKGTVYEFVLPVSIIPR